MSHCKGLALDKWTNSMQNQINTFQTKDIYEISFCTRHPDLLSPVIKEELISRGAAHCTTPEYFQARGAAFQNMGTAIQLLQQGQQRTYAPVPAATLPQQIRCTHSTTRLLGQHKLFAINQRIKICIDWFIAK